ncbi:hypothetical protein N7452_003901 [Penicillium brevicompactum]|uniref:Mid2 domain-containing protein n=1 Tax=Penicillium brevicompactum TaxID=5074 RepID=A0A9W9R0B4_PENBR|nr:hypothetical protein N7452_003901 [Penicillium brevicompactum]
MRESGFLSFALLANLSLAIKFTTPPSFEHTTDFSANPVYKEGSLLKIKWSATTQNATSLTLWQLNGTQFLQPFEYLTQGISGSVTSLDWMVQTTKNLTFSNMFYLCLFLEGDLSSLANSHYFNVTSKSEDSDFKTSTTTSVASLTTGSTALSNGVPTQSTATRKNAAAVSTTTSADALTFLPKASNHIGAGIKAAIGIGVSVVGIIIIGIICFYIKRRKKNANSIPPHHFDSRIGHHRHENHGNDYNTYIKKKSQIYELSDNDHHSSPRFELPGHP